jgi:hypothetical protein
MNTHFSLSVLLLSLGLAASAQASSRNCAIETYSGNYLTAVSGGGRVDDVIHSDARSVGTWERFSIIPSEHAESAGSYAIKTRVSRNYLTAVGGGGQERDALHSNATSFKAWEQFRLVPVGGGYYAIQTSAGYYLTAVGGGGRIQDVIHSNATRVGSWEKFRLNCGS